MKLSSILLIAFFLVAIVGTTGIVASISGKATGPVCHDADGIDTSVRGVVISLANGQLNMYYDDCMRRSTVLEYYCLGNFAFFAEIPCDGRCIEGRCTSLQPQRRVQIGTPTDMLEIGETIGSVRSSLTEFDI